MNNTKEPWVFFLCLLTFFFLSSLLSCLPLLFQLSFWATWKNKLNICAGAEVSCTLCQSLRLWRFHLGCGLLSLLVPVSICSFMANEDEKALVPLASYPSLQAFLSFLFLLSHPMIEVQTKVFGTHILPYIQWKQM